MQSIWRSCLLIGLTVATVRAGSLDAPRLYDITIETGLPHLEENLRYALERSERCLTRESLGSIFPILRHPSLAGCALREQSHDEEHIAYVLACDNATGTTGSATWRLDDHVIRGTLDVKLGGKNMTFFQRVTGTVAGECPSAGVTR